MKTAFVLFSVSSVATAFVAPGALTRSPTGLFETSTATEEATCVGAAAISALTKDVKTVFTTEEVDKLLPHRYPFALVDKVVEYEAGKVSFSSEAGIFCTDETRSWCTQMDGNFPMIFALVSSLTDSLCCSLFVRGISVRLESSQSPRTRSSSTDIFQNGRLCRVSFKWKHWHS